MNFDEYAAEAKQIPHVTDCTVETCTYGVQIITEAYVTNEDGSRVERGRGIVQMTREQFETNRTPPGHWLLDSFERAFKDRYQGYTRYATKEEIALCKSREKAATKVGQP